LIRRELFKYLGAWNDIFALNVNNTKKYFDPELLIINIRGMIFDQLNDVGSVPQTMVLLIEQKEMPYEILIINKRRGGGMMFGWSGGLICTLNGVTIYTRVQSGGAIILPKSNSAQLTKRVMSWSVLRVMIFNVNTLPQCPDRQTQWLQSSTDSDGKPDSMCLKYTFFLEWRQSGIPISMVGLVKCLWVTPKKNSLYVYW
jgi:hypothetical protein